MYFTCLNTLFWLLKRLEFAAHILHVYNIVGLFVERGQYMVASIKRLVNQQIKHFQSLINAPKLCLARKLDTAKGKENRLAVQHEK